MFKFTIINRKEGGLRTKKAGTPLSVDIVLGMKQKALGRRVWINVTLIGENGKEVGPDNTRKLLDIQLAVVGTNETDIYILRPTSAVKRNTYGNSFN